MDVGDPRPWRGVAPLVLLGLVVVLVVWGVARGVWLPNLHNGLLAAAFTLVGVYVLFQRPGHREGHIFLTTGVVEAVMFYGRQVAHSPSPDGGERWWGWLGVWPVAVGLALTTLAVICFPDGHLPSRRWAWPVRAVVAVAAACATLSALWPVEYASTGVHTVPPFEIAGGRQAAAVWAAVAHPAYTAFQAVWLVAVVARWQSASRLLRRQLIALAAAAGTSMVLLLLGLALWGTARLGVLAAASVPLAAGWAIVHGQHAAAYSALGWASHPGSTRRDLPGEVARAAAEALSAHRATVWGGGPEILRPLGDWPGDGGLEPVSLAGLEASPGLLVRRVLREGVVVGAISVQRTPSDGLSRSEARLVDHLAAQAALVIEHLELATLVARHGQAGRLGHLTTREREVLELMALGRSNAAIAEELHLSVKTVEPVVSTIFTKLDLHADATSNRRVMAVVAFLRSAPQDAANPAASPSSPDTSG